MLFKHCCEEKSTSCTDVIFLSTHYYRRALCADEVLTSLRCFPLDLIAFDLQYLVLEAVSDHQNRCCKAIKESNQKTNPTVKRVLSEEDNQMTLFALPAKK